MNLICQACFKKNGCFRRVGEDRFDISVMDSHIVGIQFHNVPNAAGNGSITMKEGGR